MFYYNNMSKFVILFLASAGMCMPGGCSMWTGSAFRDKQVETHTAIAATQSAQAQRTIIPGSDKNAVVELKTVTIPPQHREPAPGDYIIGPNDALYVNVSGLPDMGSPLAGTAGSRIIGSSVDGKGNIQLPLIQSVHVAGMTTSQAQTKIREAFKPFVKNPWVIVEVVDHRSQPIYLVGQFGQPGVYYMDRATDVVQAIAMGKGIAANADLRGACIQRGKQVLPVDIYRLLREGDLDQNIWLRPNDTVYVPDASEQQVFVLGSVANPGVYPMLNGKLDLLQALSQAKAAISPGSAMQFIRIIRSRTPTRGELIVVDANKLLTGAALPFPLMGGDIVYVPRSKLGSWNDIMKEILPSIQVVSAVVNPFVSISNSSD